MSVLIKGMEMPKNCAQCPLRASCVTRIYMDERPSGCSLVPVPPHGRLIDADALDHQIYNDIPLKVFGNIARMTEMRNIVDNAPTVIPTDGTV